MRKLITAFVLLANLSFYTPAYATDPYCTIQGSASASAYQIVGQTIGTPAEHQSATSFTLASDCTVTSVSVRLARTSGWSFNAIPKLYADNSGVPGTLLETGSSIANASIPVYTGTNAGWAYATSTFAGTTHLTAGTTYWVAVDSSGYSATEVCTWNMGGTGTTKMGDGSTWTAGNNPTNTAAYNINGTQGGGGGAVKPILITIFFGF